MKNYDFTIKVADLLHHSWSIDTIEFVNKFSTRFSHLREPWLSCAVEVTWLNDQDLNIELHDLTAPIHIECDRCGSGYDGTLTVEYADIKASVDPTDQEILTIDKKNERIDLNQRITDLLMVSLPVKTLCEECEKVPLDDTPELVEYTTIQWK